MIDYSVSVDGVPVDVKTRYGTDFAHFIASGTVAVEIRANEPVSTYTLSPKSLGISSSSSGNAITFNLTIPASLILHEVNNSSRNLCIFAATVVAEPGEYTSIADYGVDNMGQTEETTAIQGALDEVSGILYFPAGTYKTDDLYVKDGVTVHLAEGARLYWDDRSFLHFDGVSNAGLAGNGIVEGLGIRIDNTSSNIDITDIVLLPDTLCWFSCEIKLSSDVNIQRVKLITDYTLGHDGFDPERSAAVLIEDCFGYVGDDFVAVKASAAGTDISDITVQGCTIYTLSIGCKIGTQTYGDVITDVTFRDIDIVSFSYAVLGVWLADTATVSAIIFDDIRVEKFEDAGLGLEKLINIRIYTRVWPQAEIGHIDGVRINNFRSDVVMPSDILCQDTGHLVENVVFDNCRIGGGLILNIEDGDMTITRNGPPFSGVTFLSQGAVMARNVNIWMTNWQWTGNNVPTPQATTNLTLEWIDNNGNSQQWTGVVTFPNDLQLVPVSWVKEELEDLMIRAARHQLGID